MWAVYTLAVIGAVTVVSIVGAAVMFARQIARNGWGG